MQNFDISEMEGMVRPYFNLIKDVQQKSFLKTVAIKDMFIEQQVPIVIKPRSKGSIISDCIKVYLEMALANDENAKVIDLNDIPALLIGDKILIRFNKMDEKYQTSIQKRKGYWKFINQGEKIEGFDPEIVRMWAGYIPIDKQWSDIARYFLVCFDAGHVIWFNNLTDNSTVEQLSIYIPPPKTRRTKPKKKDDGGEQETKTGSES